MNIEGFAEYLRANNCEILAPTNEWEALRYRHDAFGVAVVYVNKAGRYNLGPLAGAHYDMYEKGKPLRTRARPGGNLKQTRNRQIKERDGESCCFCGKPLNGDETIEHWLSLSDGGTNGLKNTALAHRDCNTQAENLSVMEKVRLREQLMRKWIDQEEKAWAQHFDEIGPPF